MSQILEQETTQSDEFYRQEISRMLDELRRKDEKIERDQEEIEWLKEQSRKTLKRIDHNLARIEELIR